MAFDASTGIVPRSFGLGFIGWVTESTTVAVYAACGPLVVNGIETDICDGVSVPAVFGLFDHLLRPYVVDEGLSGLAARDQVSVAVGGFESYLHGAILVAAEIADRRRVAGVSDSEVPKLDGAVLTGSQKRVEGRRVAVAVVTLVEFDSMNVFGVRVAHHSDCFVDVGVVHNHFLVRPSNYADVALAPAVVEGESGNMLGRRVLERLQKFVLPTLLEPFHVVCCTLVMAGELELVEVYAVSRAEDDHAILMVKLCAPYLVLEGLVSTLQRLAVGRVRALLALLVFVDAVDVQQLLAFLLPVEVPDDAGLVGGAADQVLVVRTPTDGVDLPVVAL